jgi:hypothetical protein
VVIGGAGLLKVLPFSSFGIGEMMGAESRKQEERDMKRRIAIWASVGFLVACCWILYTFLTPPDQLSVLTQPIGQLAVSLSCPISVAGRYFPIRFWWIPPINAATYAVVGLIVEALRRELSPRLAV